MRSGLILLRFIVIFTAKPQATVTPSTYVSLKVNNTIKIHRPVANESICKNCQKCVLLFKSNSLFIRPIQYHISIAYSIYYHTHASKIYHCKLKLQPPVRPQQQHCVQINKGQSLSQGLQNHLQPGSKLNQGINTSFCTKSSDQGTFQKDDQVAHKRGRLSKTYISKVSYQNIK